MRTHANRIVPCPLTVLLLSLSLPLSLSLSSCLAAAQQPEQPVPRDEAAPERPAVTEGEQQTAPSAQPPSNTWYAVRVVRVSTAQDEEAARAAVQELTSEQMLRRLLGERGIDAAMLPAIRVTAHPIENREAVDVEVEVDLSRAPQAPRAARETADAVVATLRQRLQANAQGGLVEQASRLEAEQARATQEYQRATEQLAQLRAKIRDATGRSHGSAERLRDELAELEEARQEFQLDLEMRAARVAALSENIAKITQQVEQKVAEDPVSAELQKVVQAREQKAAVMKEAMDKGRISRGEYEEAVAEAAEARARLLERRSDVADAAGADTVKSWNRELMKLAVDSAELQARLDALNRRIEGYEKIVDDLDDLESLADTRQYAERSLQEAREMLRALNRRLATVRSPRSIITESTDRTGDGPQAQPTEGQANRSGDSAE